MRSIRWVDLCHRLGTARAKARSIGKDQSGFTAVEFAMVIVPFLMLLFATIEVCVVYFATFSLENATEQAARLIRTGQAQQTADFDAQDFKDKICERVPGFMTCDDRMMVDVQSFASCGGAAAGAPNPIDGNGELVDDFEQYSAGTGGQCVLVTVFYKWGLFASLPRFGIGLGNLADGSRLITAATAFRNEPYDQ